MANDQGFPVPSSRFARAVRLGGLTTRMATSMAGGATRDLIRGKRPEARALLLTPANAQRLTRELAKMRGAAMKMGQLISMESNDLLPPELAEILAQLRQDAHHMPPGQLKTVLSTELGADFQRKFKRFDPRPIASASIGQVHRATAKDGRMLALKIQYPGIKRAIDSDVANLGTLMRMSGLLPKNLDIAPLLEEARKQLHEEADYAREAQAMTEFADLLEGDAGFAVPRPYADLSTPHVLAMDFMESSPIEALEDAPQETRDTAMTRLFALFLRELFDWHHVQTDPNFANYRVTPGMDRIVLLDFGAARGFAPETVAGLRDLMRATAEGSAVAITNALESNGFITQKTTPAQIALILDMVSLVSPVLTARAPFDFGDTALLGQMRRLGEKLGLEEGYQEIPPIDALFVQRKLAGLVLLATRLGARVPIGDLIQPYLRQTGSVAKAMQTAHAS